MDNRKNNGGKRIGAGRKPKADEIEFLQKLDNIIDEEEAIRLLLQHMRDGSVSALSIYLSYRRGKPKETRDITINEDLPLFLD